jgi:hypothetical protein
MEMEFCVDALQNVIDQYVLLDIFNSALGGCSPVGLSLTSWPTVLSASFKDGKGRFRGNVFIDRLRHGLKYEEAFVQSLHIRCCGAQQRQPAIYLLQRHGPAFVSRCQTSRELFAALPAGIWTTLPLRCASALTSIQQVPQQQKIPTDEGKVGGFSVHVTRMRELVTSGDPGLDCPHFLPIDGRSSQNCAASGAFADL